MLNLYSKLETISNLFEGKEIRSIWDSEKEEYYFSVVDVIVALTKSDRPRKYWNDLKKKLENEGSELSKRIGQLKLKASGGKYYNQDVLDTKWGDKFIETLEKGLRLDFPNIKVFSARNLRRMKKFYLEYKDEEIMPPAVAKLPWTYNIILIEKIKDKNIRFWYANEAANGNWSKGFRSSNRYEFI